MNLKSVGFILLLGTAVVGCDQNPEGEVVTPTVTAALRYMNIVPDTGALDIRIVDIIGDAPNTVAAGFRTAGAPFGVAQQTIIPMHTPVLAGTRRIRVFLNSTNVLLTSVVMLDTTFTFDANQRYTVYLWGYARTTGTPRMKALLVKDSVPTVPTGNIAVRAINLAPELLPTITQATADVYVDNLALGSTPTGTPTFGNRSSGSTSLYVNRATGSNLRAVLVGAGTTGPLVNLAIPAGTAGTSTADPIPGANVAGTAISVIVVPRSTPGSTAPQTTAFLAPSILIAYDQLPPRTAP